MRRVTAYTTFPQRFVLEHKGATLRGVTLVTGFVLAQHSHAAALDLLQSIRATAFDRVSLVHIMTIGATDFALQNRMVMGQLEGRAHLRMALEAGGRRFVRINNRARRAAALDV